MFRLKLVQGFFQIGQQPRGGCMARLGCAFEPTARVRSHPYWNIPPQSETSPAREELQTADATGVEERTVAPAGANAIPVDCPPVAADHAFPAVFSNHLQRR